MAGRLFFGGLFCLGGVAMLLVTGWFGVQAWESSSWPSTNGEITSSKVVRGSSERVGTRKTNGRRKTKSSSSYRASVTYTYSVDGRKYIGDTIGLVKAGGMKSYAESKAAKYPEGKQVKVYYNATSPSESLLEPGSLPIWGIIFPAMGLVFIVVGFKVATGQVRERRR